MRLCCLPGAAAVWGEKESETLAFLFMLLKRLKVNCCFSDEQQFD